MSSTRKNFKKNKRLVQKVEDFSQRAQSSQRKKGDLSNFDKTMIFFNPLFLICVLRELYEKLFRQPPYLSEIFYE